MKVNELPFKQLDKLEIFNLVVSELNNLTENGAVSLQLNLPALPMNNMGQDNSNNPIKDQYRLCNWKDNYNSGAMV